jgi:hypothetical protein
MWCRWGGGGQKVGMMRGGWVSEVGVERGPQQGDACVIVTGGGGGYWVVARGGGVKRGVTR